MRNNFNKIQTQELRIALLAVNIKYFIENLKIVIIIDS